MEKTGGEDADNQERLPQGLQPFAMTSMERIRYEILHFVQNDRADEVDLIATIAIIASESDCFVASHPRNDTYWVGRGHNRGRVLQWRHWKGFRTRFACRNDHAFPTMLGHCRRRREITDSKLQMPIEKLLYNPVLVPLLKKKKADL